MDAFILSRCIPVSMYTIAKSELFLIPFFSLLLSSYGGIAVNRGDIKQAIKALRFSIGMLLPLIYRISWHCPSCVHYQPPNLAQTISLLYSFTHSSSRLSFYKRRESDFWQRQTSGRHGPRHLPRRNTIRSGSTHCLQERTLLHLGAAAVQYSAVRGVRSL